MQHTIRLPTQPSDDGWDRLFGEAVYGVGGDVGVGGEAQVQFAVKLGDRDFGVQFVEDSVTEYRA